MKEHLNGFDRFNQPWESPEIHRQRFTDLLESLEFVRSTYIRRQEAGRGETTLTLYSAVVDQQDLEHVAMARAQGLLSGMEEALPALAVPMRPSDANPGSRVFVQLAYIKSDNEPHLPRYEPPF
ncbi:hypothetical protein ACH4YO_23405 [Streptomyces noursei]|uniref:hypothetical protein n=1 Tax=Streptomyces noursei TaxID=1971 RepID=UPI0033F8D543